MKAALCSIVCVVALAACGGGGGASPAPGTLPANTANNGQTTPTGLPKHYNLIDLGAGVQPTRLNAANAIVGSIAQGGHQTAFMYQSGVVTILGTLPGDTDSIANDISDNFAIVGQSSHSVSSAPFQVLHAVRFTPGSTPFYLGKVGTNGSYANGVNNAGEIVGGSNAHNDPCFSTVTIFDGMGGATRVADGKAVAVNVHGTLAFTSFTTGGGGCTGIYLPMTDPPIANVPLPSNANTGDVLDPATDINDAGDVVGSYLTVPPGGTAGFFAHAGSAQEIDAPGVSNGTTNVQPQAINNGDLVVGTFGPSQGPAVPGHAFIWVNGALTDLNTLIPAGCTMTLQSATDINDTGAIVGTGAVGSTEHGFLLLPQ